MSDVKAKIAEARGDDPATQVLFCSGKTLKDDDSLSSSVAASGFLVLMVKVRRKHDDDSTAGKASDISNGSVGGFSSAERLFSFHPTSVRSIYALRG